MVRQFLTLSAGEAVARGLQALAFIVLARSVGPGALGAFGLAQAISSYGSLAVQRGLDLPAILQVTREPQRAPAIRAALIRLRLPVFCLLLLGAIAWGDRLLLAMAGMWLAAVVQVRWLLLARQLAGTIAIGAILSAGLFLAAALARLPIIWVGMALSAGELLAAAWYWRAAGGSLKATERPDRKMQQEAWPFLASLLLGNLLYSLDVFILGALRNEIEVGLYLAAYRFITVFSPILGALQNSALPRFGALYPDHPGADMLAWRIGVRSAGISLALALVLALTPALLLPLVYGTGFAEAARLAPVFAAVLPIQVVRMIYRQALLAFGGEKKDVQNLALAVAVNLVIDLLLVPSQGAMGCAIATLCAESCFAILTWRSWRRAACA